MVKDKKLTVCIVRRKRAQHQHKRKAHEPQQNDAVKNPFHRHEVRQVRNEPRRFRRRRGILQLPLQKREKHRLHEGNRHEAVGRERRQKMEAEKVAPRFRRYRFAGEKNGHHGARRRHDEKNPHQPRNLSHPALDKRNRHRQKHRDRHRKPEPEMNHAGAEHFHADRHQVQQRRP